MISSRGNKSSSRSLARALTIALRASKQGTRQRSLSSTCKQVYIRGKTKLVTNTGYAFNILVGGWWRVGWWRGRFVVVSWLVARLPGGEVTGNPLKIYLESPSDFPIALAKLASNVVVFFAHFAPNSSRMMQ